MDARRNALARIESWYGAALAAVEPASAVRRHLRRDGCALIVDGRHVPLTGRLVVLGVGKAAVAMVGGVMGIAGDLVHDALIVTKVGHVGPASIGPVPVIEASHPVPDERSVAAGQAALALVGNLDAGDVVVALISGGGSALLEAPRPPVTLADLASATDLLLRAGAPIHDLNAVRTPLSLVKGGGLRRAAGAATMITLVLSDVLGNDPRVIASGPTVPADPGAEPALSVLRRYDLVDRVPATIREALAIGSMEQAQSLPATGADVVAIVGENATAVAAMAGAARQDRLRPLVVWQEHRGEASQLAEAWVGACASAPAEVDVLLGGGEATVTVRGDGVGGRNTEFALGAALALAKRGDRDWTVASLATDGQDGLTEVAGAVADAGTVGRARAAGVDPVAALARNDSLRVFEAAGDLVRPGPTGTNVNDLYVAVRVGSVAR